MPNTLVAEYRKRVPSDPRSDDDLTLLLGQSNTDGRFNQYPDFLADYQRLTQPEPVEPPPISTEFRRGVNRGVASLKSSAVGIGALGADVVGADQTRDALLQKYKDIEQQSAEDNAPGVSKLEDIHGAGDAARYALGKAGELVPNVAEAVGTGAVGALVGSAAEPGGGTVAGAFLGRAAAKAALKALIEKGAVQELKGETRDLVIGQLQKIVAREAVGQLEPATQGLLETEAKAMARKYGGTAAEILNFGGLGAGGRFPAAQETNPEDAKTSALIAGIGGAASAILPASVIDKIFAGPLAKQAAKEAAKEGTGTTGKEVFTNYLKEMAKDAAQHVPAGVLSMGAMELGNIAAERYSDPKRRNEPLSDEELSRLMNAAAVGAMAGGASSPLTAIRGVSAPRTKLDPTLENHVSGVSDARRVQIEQLKGRIEASGGRVEGNKIVYSNGTPDQADISAFAALVHNPEEMNFFTLAKPDHSEDTSTAGSDFEKSLDSKTLTLDTTTPSEAAVPVTINVPDKISAGPAHDQAPVAPTEPAVSPSSAGAAVAGFGKGLVSGLYDSMWQRLSAGKYPEPMKNQTADAVEAEFKAGRIKSADDIQAFVNQMLQQKRAAAALSVNADKPEVQQARARVAAAATQTNTAPTIAQKESGNYQKGHLDGNEIGLPGVKIAIENPVGSERAGMGADGKPWKVEMPTTYGQILGTKGRDGDPLDIHIGPNPTTDTVYIVDQIDPKTGKYDEAKIFAGFESQAQAEHAYDAGFSDGSGPSRRGAVTGMPKDQFREWLKGDTTKAIKYADKIEGSVENVRGESSGPAKEVAAGKPGELQKPAGESGGKAKEKPIEAQPGSTLNPQEMVVESVGVGASARGKGNKAAKAAWDLERAKNPGLAEWKDLTKESREAFFEAHPELNAEKARVEDAWFRLSGKEDYPEVARRITSRSSAPHDTGETHVVNGVEKPVYHRDSESYRLAVVKDNETGKVHVVSAFVAGKEAKVTRFTDAVKTTGRAKALPLRRVMEARMENGEKRFQVIASALSPKLHEYFHREYPDVKSFEEGFGKPLDERQASLKRNVEAVEKANVQSKGKADEVAQEELPTSDEATVSPELSHEPEPLNLVPHEVERLVQGLKGRTFDELSDAIASGAVDPELLGVLKKIGQADRTFFGRAEEVGVEKALKEYGYETDAGKSKPVEQSATGQPEANLPGDRRGVPARASGAEAPVEGQQDISGPAKQLELPENKTGTDTGGEESDRATQVKAETPEAINAKTWYHGTGTADLEAKDLDPFFGSHESLMGQGIYLTDNRDIASGYAKARGKKTGEPSIYETHVNISKALDLEQPTTDDIRGLFRKIAESTDASFHGEEIADALSGLIDNPKASVEQILQAFRQGVGDLSHSAMVPTSEFVDAFQELTVGLRNLGYDALTHTGGKRTGNEAHQVLILLDPHDTYSQVGRSNQIKDFKPSTEIKNRIPDEPPAEIGSGNDEGMAAGTRQMPETLRSIQEAAARAGIDVQVIKGDKALGAYSPKNRTLLQVVSDTVGAQDVRTALHEVGHDVFAGEKPEVRGRLLKAVHGLTDQALGIDTSADSRIRSTDPAGLGKEALNEERLVEATAAKMANEGFKPDEAKGFAQNFVRTLKDLYYRSALAVQRWLGQPESPELARRYFENRVKSLLAGDTKGQSYVDFVGARKITLARRQEVTGTTRSTGEAFDSAGRLSYETNGDLNVAGTRFNLDAADLRFNLPDEEAPKETRKVVAERLVAVLNHNRDLLEASGKEMTKIPEIAKQIVDGGITPGEYLTDLLGIAHPDDAKKLVKDWKEVGGQRVQFDAEKRLDGFQFKANRDKVEHDAFVRTSGLQSKIDRARDESLQKVKDHTPLLERRTQALEEARQKVTDLKEIAKDRTKVIPNLDKKLLVAKIKRGEAARSVSSLSRSIEKENLKVKALEAVAPAVAREYSRLAAKLEIRPDFVFRDGANYNVPESPEASTESLSRPKNTQKLRFDAKKGEVTNQEELTRHLKQMQTFLDHREAQAAAGDENALDIGYQSIAQQKHEILARTIGGLDTDVKPRNRWGFTMTVMADGKRLVEGIGSRAARSAMRRLNLFTTHLDGSHAYNERMGRITGQLELELLGLTPKMDQDTLRRDVLTPTRNKLKDQHDLEELYAGDPTKLKRALFSRVKDMLLTNQTTKDHIGPVVDRYMPALVKLVDHQWEMAQRRVNEVKRARLGVQDARMGTIVDPATGERVSAVRKHLDVGAFTFPRKLERNFGTMVKALRGSGFANLEAWLKSEKVKEGEEAGPESSSAIESAYNEDPEALKEQMARLFTHDEHGDQVRNEFFQPLVETDGTFDDPTGAPADSALAKEALEKSGTNDPVGFAEELHALHEGSEESKGKFIADTIAKIYQRFKEADGMYRKYEQEENPEGRWAIMGMSPDALIDARTVEHLPAKWFDYHDYDRRESFGMSQRIAAEIAFGRGQQGLGADFQEMNKEVLAAKTRMDEAVREVKRGKPNATQKEIERLVKAKLGAEYETISRLNRNAKQVTATVKGLSDYFRKEGSPDLTLNYASRMAHTLGQLLVNQPASAINQLEQLFGLHLRYGAGGSTIGGTVNTLKKFGTEVAHSLTQAIGFQMTDNSWTHRLWTDLSLSDPDAVMKFSDARVRQAGENAVTQGLRAVTDITGLAINRVGQKAEHTVFRPFQPFNFIATASEKALTESLWRMVGAHVGKGVDFLRNNPAFGENDKLDSKTMGLTGREKFTFDRLTGDMVNWNMDYTDMVRQSMQRGDGTPFTNEDALKLYSMGLAEVLGESSLATMPSKSYTNSIYRIISPLLGWSFRRGIAVLEAGKTPEGKRDLASIANGVAGLALLAGGGLGTSALVNLYSEDLLGKKRNLRSMTGEDAVMGMWENLNRVGTFGLFGEGVNTMINVGGGADNRIVDVNKRVVALSAINSLTQAVASFINQGRVADYAHVVRPIMSSMGAGGALQYMQLANNLLGLDNEESRMAARSNAQNWLRASGRDIQMDVRTSDGGYSAPTPLSPSLTKMELAAYGNNMTDFQEAYREAIDKAKEMGYDDAVDHVKRAFGSRNPLKTVFRTAISTQDYQRLLATMPDSGRRDVGEAVELFNRFAEEIGARPFEGKQEKAEKPEKFTMPKLGSFPMSSSRAASALFVR